jgi:hypothetical protein
MARSPAEIQAEIVLTRDDLASRLDALQRRAPRPAWLGLALVGAGLVAGVLLTRAPIARLLAVGARTFQAGLGIAAAVVTLRRALAAGAAPAESDVQIDRHVRNRLRRAA